MALTLTEQFRMAAGGKKFMMFEVTSDGSTVSIDASDVDMDQIEFAMLTDPEEIRGSASITASNLASATLTTITSITVTGAAFGDRIFMANEAYASAVVMTPYVSKADEAAVVVYALADAAVLPNAYEVIVQKHIGLQTYTGTGIVFGPALTSGDKFNVMLIGW